MAHSNMNITGTTSGTNVKLDNVVLDVYSKEILFQAQPVMRFESVARKKTELQAMPGKKIVFLKYDSLTGSSEINETDTITPATMSTSTLDIEVTEHAKAVAMSELLLRSSITDVLSDAAKLLGMHYAKDRDAMLRDALLSGSNVAYAGGGDSRATLTENEVFDVNLIRDAVETLVTNKAPKIGGQDYICFVHPHQARSLRANSSWINVNLYASPQNILNGEIGRIEDVRFVETTMIPYVKIATQDIWADGVDTGSDTTIAANSATNVYRAVMVGDYALGLAEGLPVEMRDNGVEDFGRKHSIGYYGIWGSDLIETGHSLILETA